MTATAPQQFTITVVTFNGLGDTSAVLDSRAEVAALVLDMVTSAVLLAGAELVSPMPTADIDTLYVELHRDGAFFCSIDCRPTVAASTQPDVLEIKMAKDGQVTTLLKTNASPAAAVEVFHSVFAAGFGEGAVVVKHENSNVSGVPYGFLEMNKDGAFFISAQYGQAGR